MTDLLDQAVLALERDLFFNLLEKRYEVLREDGSDWSEITTERQLESSALRDASQ